MRSIYLQYTCAMYLLNFYVQYLREILFAFFRRTVFFCNTCVHYLRTALLCTIFVPHYCAIINIKLKALHVLQVIKRSCKKSSNLRTKNNRSRKLCSRTVVHFNFLWELLYYEIFFIVKFVYLDLKLMLISALS